MAMRVVNGARILNPWRRTEALRQFSPDADTYEGGRDIGERRVLLAGAGTPEDYFTECVTGPVMSWRLRTTEPVGNRSVCSRGAGLLDRCRYCSSRLPGSAVGLLPARYKAEPGGYELNRPRWDGL
jgi:hypothetical protein